MWSRKDINGDALPRYGDLLALTMKEGVCTKCQSALVNKRGVTISKRGGGGLSGYVFEAYICQKCGFTEFYSVLQ